MNKRKLFGFALYDFANSAYVLIFLSFLFPLFFKEVIFESSNTSDFWWGLVLSSSVALALFIGPFLGYKSDKGNRKKVFSSLVVLIVIGILSLSIFPSVSRQIYFILFLVTNALFVLSQILYDSFLPDVGEKKDASTISTFAWGFGYLGGLACLALVIGFQGGSTEPSVLGMYITGIFFAVFATIAIKFLPSQKDHTPITMSFRNAVKDARVQKFSRVLWSVFFINGGIYILTFFGVLYARETLSVGIKEMGMFLIAIQLVAFPATWAFGRIGKKYGITKALYSTLIIWGIIVLGVTVVQTVTQLAIVATLGALVLGSTQSLFRAYYMQLSESEHAGLDFGFYSLAARASAAIGPVLFGTALVLLDSPRIAMLFTLPLFIIGAYFLYTYNNVFKNEIHVS